MIQQRIKSLLSASTNRTDPYSTAKGRGPATSPFGDSPPRRTSTTRAANYKVRAGDTLGLFIPNILGKADESPPIHEDPTNQRPPAIGYPIAVREDGTISLPHIGQIKVVALTLAGVEEHLRESFVTRDIVRPGQATIMVSLIRKVDDRIEPVAPSAVTNPFSRMESDDTPGAPRTRPASEYVKELEELQSQIDAHEDNIPGDSSRKAHLRRLESYKSQHAALRRELDYQLSTTQASRENAEAELDLARSRLKQVERLTKSGYAGVSEYAAAKTSVIKAEAAREQYKRLYSLYAEVMPKQRTDKNSKARTYPADELAPKPLKLVLPQKVVEIRLKQRNEKVIPGSDSQLWIHMDDVTAGQAFVSVRTADRTVLLDEASLEEGQSASFKVNGTRFYVRMKDLRNVLIGEDFGTIQIAASRSDFQPLKEDDEDESNGEAEVPGKESRRSSRRR